MEANAAKAVPLKSHYDVVIVGGAMLGSSVAWFLSANPDFDGSVLVVERDPSYAQCSTAHTNSCMRQQFSREINVRVSQFGAEFVQNLRRYMGDDARVPDLSIQNFGYMYLADNHAFADALHASQRVQASCGAGTQMLEPEAIARDYPFYHLDDILVGSHNRLDEGYFDGNTVFDWWRRSAREKGVQYLSNEVVSMSLNSAGDRVASVRLKSGEVIGCGTLVNASGPRAAATAAMAGISIPVEPRKRYTYVFDAAQPLDRDLPLTVDPSGVHIRTDGQYYMAGCTPPQDPAVDADDFEADHSLWEEMVWPAIAHRIPQFEAIKLINSWVGHYAYNTFDQNAIVGPHPELQNFIFVNGFSGHGFQQSPAMGRGVAELITFGEYRRLDLSPFSFDRLLSGEAFTEQAVI